MLTLITGTPGSFKTAYTVWEIARLVPGSTIEAQERVTSHGKPYAAGEAVPRHLYANINGLLVDHEVLDPESMGRWHQWSQPGDVLVYDEVQSLWRPRAVGSKVPEEIQALETHRHRGVDIVLVTQHPMLLDANVRRLVNKHLHLRRVWGGGCILYEWDHCGQPGSYKTCVGQSMWRAKREGFKLYKSAQLHTKPTQGVPKVALIGVAALAGAAYLAPMAYGRITDRFKEQQPVAKAGGQQKVESKTPGSLPVLAPTAAASAIPPSEDRTPSGGAQPGGIVGCIQLGPRCECFTAEGRKAPADPQQCHEGVETVGTVVALQMAGSHGSGGFSTAQDLANRIGASRAAKTASSGQ